MFHSKTISDRIFTVLQMILQESKRSPLGSFESAGNAISKRVEGLKYQIFPGAVPLDPLGGGGGITVPPANPPAVPRRHSRAVVSS